MTSEQIGAVVIAVLFVVGVVLAAIVSILFRSHHPFHHKWKLISCKAFALVDADTAKTLPAYRTLLLYRCNECQRFKTRRLDGTWVMEDCLGVPKQCQST